MVPIQVILPVDKFFARSDDSVDEKPFKTLYLLHGIFGNYTDWVSGTRIQRWAEEKNLAVVMPSGDNAFYVDQPAFANLYGKFIGKELVEITRKMFPLSHKREDTFIGGLSMGGYGAMRNGLKYHDTFGYIASLSGALNVLENVEERDRGPLAFADSFFGDLKEAAKSDKNPKVLVEHLKAEGAVFPEVFMACGTEDGFLAENQSFRDYLKAQGVHVTYMEGPGGHDWDFWDTYIRKVIDWLPLEEGAQGVNSGNVLV